MKKILLPLLLLLPSFWLHAQQSSSNTATTTPLTVNMSTQASTYNGTNVVFFDDGGAQGNVGTSPLVTTFLGNGHYLELFFTDFDLPVGAILKVYKGSSVGGELIAAFQGGENHKPWNYKSRSFTVEYTPAPTHNNSARGWRGEIHELTADYLWAKATMPESDCINAIPICSNSTINTSANQYDNTGAVNDDAGGCYSGTGSGGSVWYQFTPQATGPLDFTIAPAGSTDYDFVLWDITAGCASRTELSCNFSATHGNTGLSTSGAATNSQDASGSTYNQRFNVDMTHRYAICINYYSGNNDGFTLTFQNNAGSVTVTDIIPPTMTNVTANSCASASTIDVFFSEYIDCNTLQNGDFTIAGRTVTITTSNCSGTPSKTRQITLSISPALAGPGTYTLNGNNCNDLCGNPLNATYSIVLGTTPVANAGPDRTVCRSPGFLGIGYSYTTVTLNGSGGTNYFWSDGQTGANINVSPSSPTTYTVSVQNGSACVSTDQVNVAVENTPQPNLGATQTVCAGFPVSLVSGVTPGGVTFQWQSTTSTNFFGQPTGFTTIAGQTGPNLTITPSAASTWYRVIITSPGGCQGTSTVRVNQGAGAFAITPSSSFVCSGASVTLSLPASMTAYTWSTGTSANAPLTVSPASTTTYTVTSTTAGCTGSASITIPVRPAPVATAAASPAMVCAGDPVNLAATPGGNSVNYSEGFEGASQGFTLVNGARNNWFHGTAAFATGTKGLYIGTASTNNNYEIGSAFSPRAATNFAYRDFAVTSFCNSNFSFKWRCNGQSGQAELRLWLVPTSFTPVAGTAITASASNILLGGPYFGQAAAFQPVTVSLTSYAGQSVRLVFEWRNTGAALIGGPTVANPAAAIDDITFVESTTYNYTWTSSPAGFSASAQNSTAFPTVPTTYNLVVTRCDGCTANATQAVTICTLLPIQISSFKADCEATKARVKWTAENENGIDFFVLQYSRDGINFEDLAQVDAIGLGNYETLVNLGTGESHYFRIKQVQLDGEANYSDIIQNACASFTSGEVVLFPNPTSGDLNVRFNGMRSGSYQVSLIDVLGRVLNSFSYDINQMQSEIILNTERLAPAVYYLKVEDQQNGMSPRLLKFVKE